MMRQCILSVLLLTGVQSDDNVDSVQMAINRQSGAPGMKCDDLKKGFFSFKTAVVTGWRMSCPKEAPILDSDKSCKGLACGVYADRFECCRKEQCSCPHGNAKAGTACQGEVEKGEGIHNCASCKDGHHLGSADAEGRTVCVANECTCAGGTATKANGASAETLCEKDNSEDCSACSDGYTMSAPAASGDQTCTANTCTCPHGTASDSTHAGAGRCMSNGDEDCRACTAGYYPEPVPAANTLSVCKPSTCSTAALPTEVRYDSSACSSAKTGQSCTVICAAGYSGSEPVPWTCSENGTLTGSKPKCNPEVCNGKKSAACFLRYSINNSICEGLTTSQSCKVACATGYTPAQEWQVTCSGQDGWTCAPPGACQPKSCNDVVAPENGELGDCGTTLASSDSCNIKCNDGYEATGTMSCSAGTLTKATCIEKTCDAIGCQLATNCYYLDNGDCTNSLSSKSKCQPKCQAGYTANGPSSCDKGRLTPAKCESNLKCELAFGKDLDDTDKGYWTDEAVSLNYAGCEHFCTQKYEEATKTEEPVTGCELAMVQSETRTAKGVHCFAHIGPLSSLQLGDKSNTAACKREATASA